MKSSKIIVALSVSLMLVSLKACQEAENPVSSLRPVSEMRQSNGNVLEYFPLDQTKIWEFEYLRRHGEPSVDTVFVSGSIQVSVEGGIYTGYLETDNRYDRTNILVPTEEGVFRYYGPEFSGFRMGSHLEVGAEWVRYEPQFTYFSECVGVYDRYLIEDFERTFYGEFEDVVHIRTHMWDEDFSLDYFIDRYFVRGIGQVFKERIGKSKDTGEESFGEYERMMSKDGEPIVWYIQ